MEALGKLHQLTYWRSLSKELLTELALGDPTVIQEELVVNGAAMNIQLYGIESQILKLLSESEGNILDNTALIETLAEAKAS